MSTMLNLGDLKNRTGLTFNAEFVTEVLDFQPDDRDKRALLFKPERYEEFCNELIRHIEKQRDRAWGVPNKPKPKAAAKAPPPPADDDDEL